MKRLMRYSIMLVLLCVVVFPQNLLAKVEYDRLTELDWSHDGKYLALGSAQGVIKVLDAQSSQLIREIQAHSGRVKNLRWSPTKNVLFSGGYDNFAKLWQIENGKLSPIVLLEGQYSASISDSIGAVDWSNDGNRVAILALEGSANLGIWNAITGEALQTAKAPSALDVQWNSSSNQFAVGGLSGIIYIRNATDFSPLFSLDSGVLGQTWLLSLDWKSDDTQLLASDGSGRVFLWDVPAQKLTTIFNSSAIDEVIQGDPFTHAALRARFSADERFVQAVNADGTIRMWEIGTGKLVSETKVPSTIVSAAWSPYGAQLALDLLTPPQSDAQNALSANNLQILVPFASLEQFNAIANVCITDSTVKASLQASATLDKVGQLAASVRALPADAIPPACAADLLAIAEALSAR